jgi:hypothetical protein
LNLNPVGPLKLLASVFARGIVESVPGLYFMGLLFQYSLSSALVGGVGRDAAYIVGHIASERPGTMRGR